MGRILRTCLQIPIILPADRIERERGMRPPAGRIENRTPLVLAVKIFSSPTGAFEFANTINVSQHGARVRVRKSRLPDERVSVASLEGDLISQARVVYCQHLIEGSFAVGLELFAPLGNWRFPT